MCEQENKNFNEQSLKLINKFSCSLQQEIKYQVSQNNLDKMQLFKIFSRDLLQRLSVYVEEISYGPEDVIIAQGQVDDSSVYFVQSGEVQIKIFDRTNSQIGQIKSGGAFGEYGFFTGLKRTATIQSCGYSKLLRIKRKYMMEAIQINQKDKEIFSNIQDQLMINNNFSFINMKCICCNESNHLAVQCPIIHYKADKERVIKQLIFPNIQNRQKDSVSRANIKKISSRKNQQQIELNIRQYQSSVLFEQSNQMSSVDELSQESGLPYDENMHTSQSQFTAQVSQKSYIQQSSLLINPMESMNFAEYENPMIFESSLNDQNENQIRVNQQKFSYSTAGFGNHSQLKDSKLDMNIIDEKNNEEEISSQEEKKQEEVIKQIQINQLVPPRKLHNFRTVNSKLTFSHIQEQSQEFKQSHNHDVYSEIEIASQFSNSKDKGNLQQQQNQFAAQNKLSDIKDINSSGSLISQKSKNYSKSHSAASYKKSNNSLISNNNNIVEQKSQNSNNNIIGQIEQNSNNNVIGQSQNQSQFGIIDQLNNSNITQTLYFNVLDFEKLHEFQEYFPHNNYVTVIDQYRKYQQKKKTKKQPLSNYTLSYDLISRAYKLILGTKR